jgi:hypothetical protein
MAREPGGPPRVPPSAAEISSHRWRPPRRSGLTKKSPIQVRVKAAGWRAVAQAGWRPPRRSGLTKKSPIQVRVKAAGRRAVAQAGRRRRPLAAALAVLVVGFCAVTARLFIWPAQGMPSRVDAIVMLNGQGDRLAAAERLAWDRRAPMLVVARGSRFWGHGSGCAARIPGVTVICFDPSPSSTRGEAEYAGRLASRYHWHSVVLVTTPDQATRARIRVGRCFAGKVYATTTPLPVASWPWAIAYEWAATFKAVVLQRGC